MYFTSVVPLRRNIKPVTLQRWNCKVFQSSSIKRVAGGFSKSWIWYQLGRLGACVVCCSIKISRAFRHNKELLYVWGAFRERLGNSLGIVLVVSIKIQLEKARKPTWQERFIQSPLRDSTVQVPQPSTHPTSSEQLKEANVPAFSLERCSSRMGG